jgi:hypothetical protein
VHNELIPAIVSGRVLTPPRGLGTLESSGYHFDFASVIPVFGLGFGASNSRSKNCALRHGGWPILQGSEQVRKKKTDGDFRMLTKTKVVLAAALTLGTASAALAGDQTDERGGYVLPGNMDGVNPVYHPGWFPGNAARRAYSGTGAQAYGYAVTPRFPGYAARGAYSGRGGQAYGYAVTPRQTHRAPRVRAQDRY